MQTFAISKALGSPMLLLRAGDVSQMSLPASMEWLGLEGTDVTGTCEEDPYLRASVMRKTV